MTREPMMPDDTPTPAADAVTTLQVSCVQMHWAKSLPFNLRRTLHFIEAASDAGSRVVLFPEATLTSYYFPYAVGLDPGRWRRPSKRCGPRRARAGSG
jgi:predicted amidohydrolase